MGPEIDPFAPEQTQDLLRLEVREEVIHVQTREGTTKEFKENFGWNSIGLYARTMAAFANARGGYLIFGVSDKPRILTGLEGRPRTSFDDLDQAKLTQSLNEIFSPEIHWRTALHDVAGKTVGLIYVFPSVNKPVMARKTYQNQGAEINEGDIVYRYNSRTERVKFSELKQILDDAKSGEQEKLMKHIDGLVRAGASNAAVLNFKTGTLDGPSGQKVLIDEALLSRISFIREGEFDEVSGAPTLKVVGELAPATTIAVGPERLVSRAITTEDVLSDFLSQSHISNGDEYIRQICSGSTSFLPVYFYRVAAGLSEEQLTEFVRNVSTRSIAKTKLLSRLEQGDQMLSTAPSMSTQYASTVSRRRFYNLLVAGEIANVVVSDAASAQYFSESIKSLTDDQIRGISVSLLPLMNQVFDLYYANGSNAKVADAVRRAACRVDFALYAGPIGS